MAIVYVLTNAAMPGLVKIGMTDRPDVKQRMADLYSTGTPLPFDCILAWEFEGANAAEVEQAFHRAFAPYRINPNREFFELDPEQPAVLLRTYPGREVTPPDPEQSPDPTLEDQAAATTFKRRSAKTNETEFLESLSDHGLLVYERVLALAKLDGLGIRWGRKGFTLYDVASGTVICRGYPPAAFRQCLHTDFGSLRDRANVPQPALDTLEAEAEQTNLFERVGKHNSLVCPTDRPWDESQLTMLTEWLHAIVAQVRVHTTAENGSMSE